MKLQHEVLECLLENEDGKYLLDVADVYDNLPIHAAAKEGHLEAVQVRNINLFFISYVCTYIVFSNRKPGFRELFYFSMTSPRVYDCLAVNTYIW